MTPYPTGTPTSAPSGMPTTAAPTETPTTAVPSAVPTSFPTWIRGNETGHDANHSAPKPYTKTKKYDGPSCMDRSEFDSLETMAEQYKNLATTFKGIVVLIDTFAHLLMDVNIDAVILLYVGLMLIHGLMLLFLLYVVYCPGLGVNVFFYYLFDESYKRTMPKRYERRCREVYGSVSDTAHNSLEHYAGRKYTAHAESAMRGARSSVNYGATVAAEGCCDTHYIARFWLIYLLLDVLLFLSGGLILFHLIIIVLGHKGTCRMVYDTLPYLKSNLRVLKEAGEESCYRSLSEAAYATHHWLASEIVTDCNADYGDMERYRIAKADVVILSIATIILCVGHWLLIHWFPTAMTFAKPESLRMHIEELIVDGEDEQIAPLIERAASRLPHLPPPEDDDDTPEEEDPTAAEGKDDEAVVAAGAPASPDLFSAEATFFNAIESKPDPESAAEPEPPHAICIGDDMPSPGRYECCGMNAPAAN